MKLDPQVSDLLDEVNATKAPSAWDMTVDQVRAAADAYQTTLIAPGPEVGEVRDLVIPGPYRDIPIRVYRPDDFENKGTLPVYINFHGGGFVVLSIDNFDHVCRTLCRDADCIVVAVDYCKSPEATFPAPVEEAWSATSWICTHISDFGGDSARIAVGGDSAGGCLATVVAQRATTTGSPRLVHQLLVYPITDTDLNTQSYRDFGDGYMLTADKIRWFFDCYFNTEQDRHDIRAAPLRAADVSGLPPTTIIAAGHDPLLSEGAAYAQRLKNAGVTTEYINFEGGVHGFWYATARLQISRDALDKAANALRVAFASRESKGIDPRRYTRPQRAGSS